MDIPKTLKIGGLDFEVRTTPETEMPTDQVSDQFRFGWLVPKDQVICLVGGMKPFMMLDTLLHEIGEALCWQMEVTGDEVNYHRVLVAVNSGLVQVLRDNPSLVAYINGVLEG